jgi:hypothetical protein
MRAHAEMRASSCVYLCTDRYWPIAAKQRSLRFRENFRTVSWVGGISLPMMRAGLICQPLT